MSSRSVVFFSMLEHGHLKRQLPIIMGLAARGLRVFVFCDSRFREEVLAAGGEPMDLFAERPLAEADATSIPIPCRYVSFAARYADSVLAQVAALRPALVVYDTFAVIGAVVARRLGVPSVNVCVGHNHAPEPTVASLRHDPRVAVSESCLRAVEVLRERNWLPDATPFSYVTTLSRQLNLYCEPPEFLREEERAVFEPIAFVGSLSKAMLASEPPGAPAFGADATNQQRLYVCLGTIIWRYYESTARALLESIRVAVDRLPGVTAIVSLGRAKPGPWVDRLSHARLRVESYVDQWQILRHASVFLTHQGLNSTHEAIYLGVPMISYPFFADQPALSRRCRELGLAVPLVGELRGRVEAADVVSALARVEAERATLQARLLDARGWELATIEARGAVIERLAALMA